MDMLQLQRRSRQLLRLRGSPCSAAVSAVQQRGIFTDFHVHPEVAEALKANKPVVALESTIISHGMPYPRNIEVAERLEQIIRENGAIPATIAIINGFPKIGLTSSELKLLAQPSSDARSPVIKASRRDVAYACAHRLNAATTVASTMMFASMAGIRVFATGGIGGVHRGAEDTFDVSADLQELARTPVTVVSSGVKSILDISKTLEVLETMGVPVCGYQTSTFPAFFTNDSGHKAPLEVENALAVARMMACQDDLLLHQGMIVAVPNPSPSDDIEEAIQKSLASAAADNVTGSKVTPYVLAMVKELTEGKSLEANVALVENNARVGALIACAYAPLAQQVKKEQSRKISTPENTPAADVAPSPQPVTENSDDAVDPDSSSGNTKSILNFLKGKVAAQKKKSVSLSSEELDAMWDSIHSVDDQVQQTEVSHSADLESFRGELELKSSLKEHVPNTESWKQQQSVEQLGLRNDGTSDGTEEALQHEFADVVVFGGAVVDQIMTPLDTTQPLTIHSSNPGRIRSSYGGVGRNIAEAIARLGLCRPLLVSAVGLDHAGEGLLKQSKEAGVDVSAMIRPPSSGNGMEVGTATYAAVHDHRGDLAVAIADMDIFHDLITPTIVGHLNSQIKHAKLVVADGNLSEKTMKTLANVCSSNFKPLFFEPTSDHKCLLPVQANAIHQIDIIKPNLSELRVLMTECCLHRDMTVAKKSLIIKALKRGPLDPSHPNYLADARILASGLLFIMMNNANGLRMTDVSKDGASDRSVMGKHVLVTLGDQGLLWVSSNGEAMGHDGNARTSSKDIVELDDNTYARHIKPTLPLSPIDIVNTCGAGDTFCAGLIHSIINPNQQLGFAGGGQPNVSSMLFAMKYAEKSLKSPYAVPASVDLQDLLDSLRK